VSGERWAVIEQALTAAAAAAVTRSHVMTTGGVCVLADTRAHSSTALLLGQQPHALRSRTS
jgi:hypothetical protein